MTRFRLCLGALLASAALTVPAMAQEGPWHEHEHEHHGPGWEHGPHFFHPEWNRGRWFHGWHGGVEGWWWVVAGAWYYYPAPVYPFPEPPSVVTVLPPQAPGQAYYCPPAGAYYPQVQSCPGGWQGVMVAPQAPPQPQPVPVPPPGYR